VSVARNRRDLLSQSGLTGQRGGECESRQDRGKSCVRGHNGILADPKAGSLPSTSSAPFDVVSYRDRIVDEEERWHAIGSAGGIAILFVVHTSEEQHGEEEIRIISARKGSLGERALYYSYH
jgi:uncharacterized DUF497 family protein